MTIVNNRDVIFSALIIATLIWILPAGAQKIIPTLPTGEFTSFSVTDELDHDSWILTCHLNRDLDNGVGLNLNQTLNLILYQTPGSPDQIKYSENFDLHLHKRISRDVNWLLTGELEQFFDQQTQGRGNLPAMVSTYPQEASLLPNTGYSASADRDNEIRRIFLGSGGSITLFKVFLCDGLLGPLYEYRRNKTQLGSRYQLELDGLTPVLGFRLKSRGWLDHLKGGNDNGLFASLSGKWESILGTQDELNVDYRQTDQREYLPYGSDYTRRVDENFRVTNILESELTSQLGYCWETGLTRQLINHIGLDRSFYELMWQNGINFTWQAGAIHGQTTGGIDLQEQKFSGSISKGIRTKIGLQSCWRISPSDSLALELKMFKYQYDTPEETDHNDRDELRSEFALSAGMKVLPELGVRVKLECDLRHLVYIYRDRSGENRWSRMFRLAIEVPWTEKFHSNNAYFAVMSNYTDYDYAPAEDQLSRVYRSFTAIDTLQLKIHKHVTCDVQVRLTLDDHGQLKWQEWIEDLSEDGQEFSITVLPTYSDERFSFSFGWLRHSRQTYLHQAQEQRIKEEDVQSQGPVFVLVTAPSGFLNCEISGKYLFVKDRRRGTYILPDLSFRMIWLIGKR